MFENNKNRIKGILVLIGLCGLLNSSMVQAQCTGVSVSDSLELVNLYMTTDGANWWRNDGWLIDPVDDWYGVNLSDDGCNVTGLNMTLNELDGPIPDINLPELEGLWLAVNDLTGTIPDFSHLPKLKNLELTRNQLTGTIPDFSNLPNLTELEMSENQLTGTIPDFSNMPDLNYLTMYKNQLTGTLPDFSNLPNLTVLRAEENQLSGSIPDFSNMENLEDLILRNNQLSGSIPNFSNLPNLNRLFITNNQFSGTIPDFSNMAVLRELLLSNNQFSGSIPNFSNLPILRLLWLNNNQLTDTVPNFSNFEVIEAITASGNQLTGTIPDFSNIPTLAVLDLSNNQLTGTIPNFSNLPNLIQLSVCPNPLVGGIPNFIDCPLLDALAINFSCVQGPKLTGYAYHDLNGNCVQEAGESIIPNALVATDDYSHYTFTDENGFYTLQTDLGTYTFDYFPPNYLWEQSCPIGPTSYTATLTSLTDSLGGFDFANEATANCPLMTVEIGTSLLRRCFTNTYTVDYCNTGTVAADDVSVYLWFPDDIIPLSSSLPYTVDADDFLVFDLGTVGIGECSSFTVTDSVSCDAFFGSTACVEAYIFPDTLCFVPDGIWDESNITVNGYCLGSTVQFRIENVGAAMADSSDYKMYEDDVLKAFDKFKLDSGEFVDLNYTATGQTFRVTAEQRPGHPFGGAATDVVELCGSMPFSLGYVNSQFDEDATPFYDQDCQEIIGSYDPNDKSVTPRGVFEGHHITKNTELEYHIRFQNIGNDTAFQVIVIDTIDTNFLDVSTLRLGVSSHDYTFEVKNGNVFIFTFSDILLVDSTTNEPASHGFLKFNISQNADNPEGELIENEAGIYFDYNQPVITNKVFNTIGLPDLATGIEATFYFRNIETRVFLDHEQLHIEVPFVEAHTDYSFSLYNVLGQQMAHINKLSVPHHSVNVGNLPSGVYVFEIQASDGSKSSERLVIP